MSACEYGKNRYPCTIGYHSVFFSKEEEDDYYDLLGSSEYDTDTDRMSAMKALAKKRTNEWKSLKVPKKKTNVVRFR